LLDDAAVRAPDRAFLVERLGGASETLTFAQAAERSRRVGTGLRLLGASPERPVMILSDNGIDHALITLGALRAGVPVVPIDPAGDAPIRAIAALVRPAVVFARDGVANASTARTVAPNAAFVSVTRGGEVPGISYRSLLAHPPIADDPSLGADTVAKILFEPSSPDEPRGVVVTHGMICAMQQGIAQAWPFLAARPPVIVDRSPWSGCLGGNEVLGIALHHAGTVAIGDAQQRSDLAPTLAFGVPQAWARWVERLRADDELRRHWLSSLDLAVWEGATLAPPTRHALHAIGIALASRWGSLHTAGAIAVTRGGNPPHDALGVPLAGVELKLVPRAGAYEARVRGPQVTPGYFWRPDLTAQAFDEEGFYRIGDLVRPIDRLAPQRGLAYVGRIDGRFKLGSGTWVPADDLRAAFLAQSAPDVADVVVTGQGHDVVGLLVWPSADGALLDGDVLRAQIGEAMLRVGLHLERGLRPRRALVVREPRTAVKPAQIARLYASEPDAEVILV
jgi:feruloyl-CoA synthase